MSENTTLTKYAIVTGGTRGIGFSISEALSHAGFAVTATYAGNTDSAKAAEESLTNAGLQYRAVKADVADETQMGVVFSDLLAVDVVVNAAGVMPLGPLVDTDLAELDAVLRTNVRGTFVVNKLAASLVRPGGSIINLSSSVTRFQNPGNAAYIASKAAVESITMVLARELRGRNITVNAVAPGAIDTEMLEKFLANDTDGSRRAGIASQSPLERLGMPEDIAEIVRFLATGARWLNGQVLFANGGAI